LELDGRLDLQDFDKIYNEINEIEEEPTCELPEEMISLCNKRLSYSSKKPLNYLHSRGIDDDQIKLWKIGYCVEGRYSGRIIIPSFNLNGDPNFFIARSFVGHRMKYLNPRTTKDIIFNELMVDWDEPVVIVEGAFDALVAGSQAIPVLGSTLRPQSRLFQALAMNDTPVYIGLDADAEKKASWMIKKMIEYDMEVYRIDTSAVEDIGSMTPRQFENAKDRAQPIDPDYFFFDKLLNAI
jgi:DNA primase